MQTLDKLGYEGILLGAGAGRDPWIVATSLIKATTRLKFIIDQPPSHFAPALAARMAATFDQLSRGRCLLNISSSDVSSGDISTGDGPTGQGNASPRRDKRRGRHHELTDEWLHIYRRLFSEDNITIKGRHLRVKGARHQAPAVQRPYPGLYGGGASPESLEVAAKHVDLYLAESESPQRAALKFERLRQLAAGHARTVRFGVRARVIVRETEAQARAAAGLFGVALNSDDGTGVAPDGGIVLVGAPWQIAALLQQYAAAGADTFVLSGYPQLEEACAFADLVFPLIDLEYDDSAQANLHALWGDDRAPVADQTVLRYYHESETAIAEILSGVAEAETTTEVIDKKFLPAANFDWGKLKFNPLAKVLHPASHRRHA